MSTLSLRPRQPTRAPSPMHFTDDEDDEEPTPAPRKAPRPAKKRPRELGSDDEAEDQAMPRPLVLGRAWLPAEDALLLKAVDKYGPSWTAIAAELQSLGTGRTTAMCRNRYQRIKAPLQEGKEGRNRCKRCGQIKRGHTCTADDVAGLPLPGATDAVASAQVTPPPGIRGRVAPARKGPGSRRGAPATFAPTAVCPLDALCSRAAHHRGPCKHVGGELLIGAADVLPDTPVCPPPSGNDFKIDVDAFLASVNGLAATEDAPAVGTVSAGPPAADDAAPSATFDAAIRAAAPPLHGYLANAAPPPIALRSSSGSAAPLAALAEMANVDLCDLVDVDLNDLSAAAASALASRSFRSFGRSFGELKGASFSEADLPLAPPAPARQSTPTTLCEEGAASSPTLPPNEAALDPLAPKCAPVADDAAPDAPLPMSPPAELVARRLRLPSTGGAPAGAFDAMLDETPLVAPRPASPIKHIPELLQLEDTPPGPLSEPRAVAPPLMPLPSWSRAPSFSFAEHPLEAPPPPPRGLRRLGAIA